MAQELRLKTNDKPTIFNKDMLLGGLIGSLLGSFFAGPVGLAIWLGSTVIGSFIGGSAGKSRIERENIEGKLISKPSLLNKETVIGGLLGLSLMEPILLGGIIASGTGGLFAGLVSESEAVMAGTAGTGAIISIMGALASPFIGTYLGSKSGERHMEREYDEAKQDAIISGLSQNVSPEVGQAVAYSMEHNKGWAKDVLQDKLLAAAQGQEQAR